MNNEQINFKFAAIQILSKRVLEMPPGKAGTVFSFEIKVEVKVQLSMKLVIPHITVQIIDDETKKELAEFVIDYLFEVEDFDKVIVKNTHGLYVIPELLENIIKPVSVSTTRGIIYSELRGTYLHSAVMPVVFMDKFVADNTTTP